MELPVWFKIKGYYHISPQSSGTWKEFKRIEQQITSESFVAKYAFYPLLHTTIDERRYKKIHPNKKDKKRAHSYIDKEGKPQKNIKQRPLHYANHFDALIMSYYANQLQTKYDKLLEATPELHNSITAYRKIPTEANPDKKKGNIHFAKDVFDEIKNAVKKSGDTIVMAFDIKSFFSTLNHSFLYKKWAELINEKELPPDHLNVFKSATKFSFIYKNDLKRLGKGSNKRYDEKRLANIRNNNGYRAYFDSPKDFRNSVKEGKIHIFQNQFKNNGKQVGIPQGLPISAVLANLYLLDFDKTIIEKLVEKENCFYRRYSDDIIIICKPEQMKYVEEIVTSEMKKQEVIISDEKTEVFKFEKTNDSISVSKKVDQEWVKNLPLMYLGFEFYGNKTLIKSSNLSKFYRRMIYAVKRKSKLAMKIADKNGTAPILFKRQLYKIYRHVDLDYHLTKRNYLSFKKLDTGEYRMQSEKRKQKLTGNYFAYAKRAAEIMEEPAILEQIRNEKKIFNQALDKHFHSKRK